MILETRNFWWWSNLRKLSWFRTSYV